MWSVKGILTQGTFLDLTPETVLYQYDGPRTFTCKDQAGGMFLAHWCDEDSDFTRFVVVIFSEELLAGLTTGKINMREALERPQAWVVDLDNDGNIARMWEIEVDDLPSGVLPKPGVMLWRHLTPTVARTSWRKASFEVKIAPPDFRPLGMPFRGWP